MVCSRRPGKLCGQAGARFTQPRQHSRAAFKQSQSSGDPTQLSLGILNTYSSMSAEERLAVNWTPAVRDNAMANYKSSSHILSMLSGM